jgi:hypothetical protein
MVLFHLSEPMFELQLLTLDGAAIQTTYASGPTIAIGRPRLIRAHAMIAAAAGSQLGAVTFKAQGTKDPADPNGWEDVASSRDDSGAVELEHTYQAPAGASASHSFSIDVRALRALRILARSTGAGQPGDSVSVAGIPW